MSAMTDDNQANGQLRKVKKSETLEVRIPFETKQAFLIACREDGTTASEVVRESVQTYLDERERPTPQVERTLIMKLPQPVRRYGPRVALGGLAALGITSLAVLPSAAAPDFASMFKRLDANSDGVLTAEEFAGPKDEDGKDVVVETRHITRNGKDAAALKPLADRSEFKQDAYSFWLPQELGGGDKEQHQFEFIAQRALTVNSSSDPDATPQTPATISTDDIRKRVFDTYDSDKDGKVSLAEFQARQRAMMTRGFDILDANHDKYLTEAEYAKIANPPIIRLSKDDPDTPNPPEVNIGGRPKISAEALKAAFTGLDANRDNKLSLQEYLPPA